MSQRIFLKYILVLVSTASALASSSQIDSASDLASQVKAEILNYFSGRLGIAEEDIVIEYSDIGGQVSEVPTWDEIKILPSRKTVRKGIQIVKCALFYKGQLKKSISLKLRVKTFQTVVVNKERLNRHALLQPTNLVLSHRETTKLKNDFYLSTHELIGMRTKRIIQPGEILTESVVETPPVISRGSPVDIHFHKGGLKIIIPGIARQDGYLGKQIRVKCQETRKIFNGNVMDSKTVIVNL